MRKEYYFIYGSIFSAAIPLLFALKKLNRYQTVIVILITVSFLTDLITWYLIRGRNYFFLHIYGILEALILLYFYSLVLGKSRAVVYGVALLYGLFYAVNSVWWEYGVFNTYARSIECLIMIGLAFSLFYQFYKEENDIFIDQSPLFWMNIAILTYFSGAFFSFILSKEILSGPLPWMLHNVCNALKNILFSIALWKIRRPNSKAI
jgi:hypothetical protein